MDLQSLCGIEAVFVLEKNVQTTLSVRRRESGDFDVSCVCTRTRHLEYRAHEVVRREGVAECGAVYELAQAVQDLGVSSWYHHYRSEHRYWVSLSESKQWSIRFDFANSVSRRWEGSSMGPDGFDKMFERLVEFGMCSIPLDRYQHMSVYEYDSEVDCLERLAYYEVLLREKSDDEDIMQREKRLGLLCSELIEDLKLFLDTYAVSRLGDDMPRDWGKERSVQELAGRDVSTAPRAQLYALFRALTLLNQPQRAARELVENGTWHTWHERLREVPREEEAARIKRMEEEREELRQKADAAVSARIERGDTFTTPEVAHEIGATSSLVSARVRRFVAAGSLVVVGEQTPRVYRAA